MGARGIEQWGSGVLVTELWITFGHGLLTTGLCGEQGRKRLGSTVLPREKLEQAPQGREEVTCKQS